MTEPTLNESVREAAGREQVRDAVANVYRALTDAIETRRPLCVSSGRCCRFEAYGHRLFVTTMELAAFVHDLAGRAESNPDAAWDGAGCPFQTGKLCGVHAIRPFGCRIFFCDETSTEWQHQTYEMFHVELKRLHKEHGIPYFYVEWRTALRSLGLTER